MLRYFLSLILLIFTTSVFAETSSTTTTTTDPSTGTTTVIEKKVIISPVPKYASCSTIAAHWEGNIWVDTQTVCKYENRVEGVAWVQSYWACTVYNVDSGDCTTWEYQPGHWLKTLP